MAKSKEKLTQYRKKRHFNTTPEPYGKVKRKKTKNPIFVIQLHDASHLHYDFRIEIDGVLKSWAIPKGPSTNPSDKRLAIETEDHPMEYAQFEGIIPEGYGAGTVMIWDYGTFENVKSESMHDCYKDGAIEIKLNGKKLKGIFALVHPHSQNMAEKNWLFFKTKDEYANKKIVNTTKSAVSGRTLKKIEADKDAYWE